MLVGALQREVSMRYNVMAGGTMGVFGLKRDTLEGAVKKARELR